jgi:hypothetical protein
MTSNLHSHLMHARTAEIARSASERRETRRPFARLRVRTLRGA